MPAIITHHLFGEDAVAKLPSHISFGQEELLAFLLGNQGPDPFYFRSLGLPGVVATCNKLGDALHEGKVVEALLAAWEASEQLPEPDRALGSAFVLGLAGHYVLDSTAHPFIYAQQNALCDTSEELPGSEAEVHALIESDIDSWMLWSQRGITIEEAPTTGNLTRTTRVTRVAGAILSQVASQVFGIAIGPRAYSDAVADMELIYKIIDPYSPGKASAIARAEQRLLGTSQLEALAHRIVRNDECPAANLECHRWRNPHTGKPSNLSFPDLYFVALDRWPAFAPALSQKDGVMLRALTGGLNYNGVPEV